jgi:hypothetical protein
MRAHFDNGEGSVGGDPRLRAARPSGKAMIYAVVGSLGPVPGGVVHVSDAELDGLADGNAWDGHIPVGEVRIETPI